MLSMQDQYPSIIKEVRGRGCLIGIEFEDTKPEHADKYGFNWAIECERYISTECRVQVLHSFNNARVFRWL